jgi:hypothetical protein
MSYLEEATAIWREFVPPSGQADTVQGELLRAVEKLRDEAIRNGNGNWDQGFEILLAFLHQHLLDEDVYPSHLVEETRSILVGLRDEDDLWLQDEPYDFLGDRVVDYFRHYGSKPHTKNSALYR